MPRVERNGRSLTQLTSSSSLSLTLRLPSSSENESVGELQEPVEREKATEKSVTWTDDTVDNEHLNKKKSKVCCIYHPKHSKKCKSSNEQDKNAYEIQPEFPQDTE